MSTRPSSILSRVLKEEQNASTARPPPTMSTYMAQKKQETPRAGKLLPLEMIFCILCRRLPLGIKHGGSLSGKPATGSTGCACCRRG